MPSLEDMQVARPLCRRTRLIRNGQHGRHVTCWQPLVYLDWDGGNLWWCESCQQHTDGGTVASQYRTVALELVA
jgi:hypothetical protein